MMIENYNFKAQAPRLESKPVDEESERKDNLIAFIDIIDKLANQI